MALPKILLLSAIAVYRKTVSPLLPASCRFYPSCSQFASEAIEKHGAGRGALLTLDRLIRCHPWNPGGVDPVPDGDVTAESVHEHPRGPGRDEERSKQ